MIILIHSVMEIILIVSIAIVPIEFIFISLEIAQVWICCNKNLWKYFSEFMNLPKLNMSTCS